MSHLFAIGVDQAVCKSTPLIREFAKNRFVRSDIISLDYTSEANNYLESLNTNLEWYFATDEKGNFDLDLTYRLPKEIDNGRLKSIFDIIMEYNDIVTIGIFMYDLGTKLSATFDDLKLDDIKATIKSWYEFGGPDRTVYHLFMRK